MIPKAQIEEISSSCSRHDCVATYAVDQGLDQVVRSPPTRHAGAARIWIGRDPDANERQIALAVDLPMRTPRRSKPSSSATRCC